MAMETGGKGVYVCVKYLSVCAYGAVIGDSAPGSSPFPSLPWTPPVAILWKMTDWLMAWVGLGYRPYLPCVLEQDQEYLASLLESQNNLGINIEYLNILRYFIGL